MSVVSFNSIRINMKINYIVLGNKKKCALPLCSIRKAHELIDDWIYLFKIEIEGIC